MKLSLHTEICETLGIEYPIFAFSHCRDVIAEVCNAGGFGVLGVADMTPDDIRTDVEGLRKLTDKPFGLDLVLPQTNPETGTLEELMAKIPRKNIEFLDKLRKELGLPDGYEYKMPRRSMDLGTGGTLAAQMEELEVIYESKPALFAGGLGINDKIVAGCHKAGIKVVSLVGNVRQARRVAGWGVDIIVAQGTEAGGHTGRIGTMALVPQVVDAVKPIPVLAAGGIGDGRQLVAALALGAVGGWTGTIWLTAHEHHLEEFLKERIIEATEEDAVISKCYTGRTTRTLRNKFVEYWEQPGAPKPAPAPYQSLGRPVPAWVTTEDKDRTWEKLNLQDWIGSPAGQVVGLIKQRKPAKQIFYDMVSKANDILGT